MLKKIRKQMTVGILVIAVFYVVSLLVQGALGSSPGREPPEALRVGDHAVTFERIEALANHFADQLRTEGSVPDTEVQGLALRRAVEVVTDRLLVLALAEELGTTARTEEVVRAVAQTVGRDQEGRFDPALFDRLRKGVPASRWREIEAQTAEDITFRKTALYLTEGLIVTEPMRKAYHAVRFRPLRVRHIAIRPGDFVPDTEVRAYYETHRDSFLDPPRATFRLLVFSSDGGADGRRRAFLTHAALVAGASFDRIYEQIENDTDPTTEARRFVDVPRANLGPYETHVWYGPLRRPSSVIAFPDGPSAIAYPESRSDTTLRTFSEVEDDIRARLAGEEEVARARGVADSIAQAPDSLARLAAARRIDGLLPGEFRAADYPDTETRDYVLDLLVSLVGDENEAPRLVLSPPIDRALSALEGGEATNVVRTRTGFHLFLLEDRGAADTEAYPARRDMLKRQLAADLRNGVFRAYLRGLRDDFGVRRNPYLDERL